MTKRYNPDTNFFDWLFPNSIGASACRALDAADAKRKAQIGDVRQTEHTAEYDTENLRELRIGIFYPSEQNRASASYSRQVVDFPHYLVELLFPVSYVPERGDFGYPGAHECGRQFCKMQSMSEEDCVEKLLQYLARNKYKFHPKLKEKFNGIHLFLWMCRQSQLDPGTLTLVIDGPVDEMGPYVSM